MTKSHVYAGFTELTINSLFSKMPEFFDGQGVLITCLDSSSAPAGATPWRGKLSASGISMKEIGEALWIQASQVNKLFKDAHAFSGFDEIYLLRNEPPKDYRSKGHFTTDRVQFNQYPPDEVLTNMHRLGALRYVSDGIGIGLNFVCESESLRATILGLKDG